MRRALAVLGMVGNAFRNRVIRARSTDEAMVVRSLTEALGASNRGLHSDALEHVRTAQQLLPDFFEVWRVSAQVKDATGDVIGAAQDFETAVDLADGRSEPLLVFYAQFLRRQDNFERAVEILESAATKPDATHQLVATYAWMLTLSARPVEAVEVFGSVHEELLELSGPGRAQYITQYVEALRRASEQERRRSLPDDAMQYLLQALGITHQAVTNGIIDDQLVTTAQDCCREACFLLSQRCLDKEWQAFAGLAAELAPHFDLVGPDNRGVSRLLDNCPALSSTPEFLALFHLGGATDRTGADLDVRSGIVTSIGYGRDFGFVRADDGEDFFLHRGNWRSGSWDELRRLSRPRVTFTVAPASAGGRLRLARAASLESPAAEAGESTPVL
jgi:tetratricopeptide (TPR) repeat protein